MQRRDLIERLVPLIPPPRAHQVRYHGILAPGASLRERVVPALATEPARAEPRPPSPPGERIDNPPPGAGGGVEPPDADAAQPRAIARRTSWAALLQRVFAIDALTCPSCGSTLRLLAAIEDPLVARVILECMDLPARAPPAPRTSPEPQVESIPSLEEESAFDFDQTSPYHEG